MRIGRSAREVLRVPLAAPDGVSVRREETTLSLSSPLPGRRLGALVLCLLTMLALGALLAALRAHPASSAATAAWWVVVCCSALSAAITAPLALYALRLRRLVVLTPGVLVVREGWGPAQSTASCLRDSVHAVELETTREGRASVRVVAELSPTALRLLGFTVDPAADDGAIAATVTICRGERREVALFLGRLIADWADTRLSTTEAPQAR